MFKKLLLALAIAFAPIAAGGFGIPEAHAGKGKSSYKSKSVGRPKTQRVRSYTTKKGTHVNSYKRAPARRR